MGLREHRIVEAIDRSRYADQLAWWLKHYPREQLLLLQYERCVADAQAQLSRTFEFLGLPDQPASVSQISQTRKKAPGHVELPVQMRMLLAARFADDIDRLGELMPDLDRSLWKSAG